MMWSYSVEYSGMDAGFMSFVEEFCIGTLQHCSNAELSGLDIKRQQCVVEHANGKVYLNPLTGATSVNTDLITNKTKLTHGNHKTIHFLCTIVSVNTYIQL